MQQSIGFLQSLLPPLLRHHHHQMAMRLASLVVFIAILVMLGLMGTSAMDPNTDMSPSPWPQAPAPSAASSTPVTPAIFISLAFLLSYFY
ncbi:hypothetical protein MRB53_016216 [Persea americana]|uniref:Uncharacterized protein n=1 Tax=Persea americana TaxID=3435 RepID=A0ACC2M1A5_PERAE|nr:hypothetical protein MRB53_016216 [Persea americana]